MSDNVAVEFPQIEFVRPCNLCPHMKLITLPKILDSLQSMKHVVEVDPLVAERARRGRAANAGPEPQPAADMPNNSNRDSDLVPLYPILYEETVRRACCEDLGRGGRHDHRCHRLPGGYGDRTHRCAGAGPHRRHRRRRLRVSLPRSRNWNSRSGCRTEKTPQAGETLAVIRGAARPILSAERTALNFLAQPFAASRPPPGISSPGSRHILRAWSAPGKRLPACGLSKNMPCAPAAAPIIASASTMPC